MNPGFDIQAAMGLDVPEVTCPKFVVARVVINRLKDYTTEEDTWLELFERGDNTALQYYQMVSRSIHNYMWALGMWTS